MGCVYVATNLVNGKQYVGLTTKTIEVRRKEHEWYANRPNDPHHQAFQSALAKYGFDNFSWDVVFEGEDLSDLRKEETRQIVERRSSTIGYNLSDGGEFGRTKSMVEVVCYICCKHFSVAPAHYNRSIKRGHNFICSPECLTLNRIGDRNSRRRHRD